MRIFKYIIVLALLGVIVMFGVLFSIQNTATVPLDLLVIQLPEARVALWVFLALTVGGIIGMSLSTYTIVRLKGESILLRRQLARSKKDLGRLRQRESRVPATKG